MKEFNDWLLALMDCNFDLEILNYHLSFHKKKIEKNVGISFEKFMSELNDRADELEADELNEILSKFNENIRNNSIFFLAQAKVERIKITGYFLNLALLDFLKSQKKEKNNENYIQVDIPKSIYHEISDSIENKEYLKNEDFVNRYFNDFIEFAIADKLKFIDLKRKMKQCENCKKQKKEKNNEDNN